MPLCSNYSIAGTWSWSCLAKHQSALSHPTSFLCQWIPSSSDLRLIGCIKGRSSHIEAKLLIKEPPDPILGMCFGSNQRCSCLVRYYCQHLSSSTGRSSKTSKWWYANILALSSSQPLTNETENMPGVHSPLFKEGYMRFALKRKLKHKSCVFVHYLSHVMAWISWII